MLQTTGNPLDPQGGSPFDPEGGTLAPEAPPVDNGDDKDGDDGEDDNDKDINDKQDGNGDVDQGDDKFEITDISQLPNDAMILPEDFKPGDDLPVEEGDTLRVVRRCIRARFLGCIRLSFGRRRCYWRCLVWRYYSIG